jgi:hypothetical protein
LQEAALAAHAGREVVASEVPAAATTSLPRQVATPGAVAAALLIAAGLAIFAAQWLLAERHRREVSGLGVAGFVGLSVRTAQAWGPRV